MKKYILTLLIAGITLPLFAFNFINEHFEVDAAVKAELNTLIEQEISVALKDDPIKYLADSIILQIKNAVRDTKKNIDRNANMRNRFPNKKFIAEQKEQQIKYENIMKWYIPEKISNYIKENFDLQRVSFVRVVCTHVNDTAIDVHFSYDRKGAVVKYTYTETYWNPLITHTLTK